MISKENIKHLKPGYLIIGAISLLLLLFAGSFYLGFTTGSQETANNCMFWMQEECPWVLPKNPAPTWNIQFNLTGIEQEVGIR